MTLTFVARAVTSRGVCGKASVTDVALTFEEMVTFVSLKMLIFDDPAVTCVAVETWSAIFSATTVSLTLTSICVECGKVSLRICVSLDVVAATVGHSSPCCSWCRRGDFAVSGVTGWPTCVETG